VISDYYLSDLLLETSSERAYGLAGGIVQLFLKKVIESEVTLEELDGLYTRALFMELMLAQLGAN